MKLETHSAKILHAATHHLINYMRNDYFMTGCTDSLALEIAKVESDLCNSEQLPSTRDYAVLDFSKSFLTWYRDRTFDRFDEKRVIEGGHVFSMIRFLEQAHVHGNLTNVSYWHTFIEKILATQNYDLIGKITPIADNLVEYNSPFAISDELTKTIEAIPFQHRIDLIDKPRGIYLGKWFSLLDFSRKEWGSIESFIREFQRLLESTEQNDGYIKVLRIRNFVFKAQENKYAMSEFSVYDHDRVVFNSSDIEDYNKLLFECADSLKNIDVLYAQKRRFNVLDFFVEDLVQ